MSVIDKTKVEECATDIVSEFIVYNKIKMNVKNIWIEKLIEFFGLEKPDYNLFQHSKVMAAVKNIPSENGIGDLLEFLKRVDNEAPQKLKDKKEELTGQELKDYLEKEFHSMNFGDKVKKTSGWFTCGCQEGRLPKYLLEWVKTIDDKDILKDLRERYTIGRDKWNSISRSQVVRGMGI